MTHWSDTAPYAATCETLASVADALPDISSGSDPSIAARYLLAQSLKAFRLFDRAEAVFGAISNAVPNHRGACLGQIDCAMEDGRFDDALTLSQQAVIRLPEDPEVARREVSALLRLGRRSEARTRATEARGRMPADIQLLMQLGTICRDDGDLQAADAQYLEVLAKSATHRGAHLAMIDVAFKLSNPELALARCDRALAVLPDDNDLVERKARALADLGRSLDAMALLKEKIADEPGQPVLHLRLAIILRSLGDHEGAEAHFQSILAERPAHVAALSQMVDTALAQGDLDAALERLQTALKVVPDDAALMRKKADVLLRAGQGDAAVDLLKEMIAAKPQDVGLHVEFGRALRYSGDQDGADAVFAEVLRLQPGNRHALMARVDIAEAKGDLQRAIALLEANGSESVHEDARPT